MGIPMRSPNCCWTMGAILASSVYQRTDAICERCRYQRATYLVSRGKCLNLPRPNVILRLFCIVPRVVRYRSRARALTLCTDCAAWHKIPPFRFFLRTTVCTNYQLQSYMSCLPSAVPVYMFTERISFTLHNKGPRLF